MRSSFLEQVGHGPSCYCPSCTRRKRRDALEQLIESYPPRTDEAGQLEWERKVMNLALAMHAARNGGSIEDYELVYTKHVVIEPVPEALKRGDQ